MPKTDVGAGTAVIVFNSRREFFMLKRHSKLGHVPGAYCMPGGWIEKFEATLDAGRREVMEEIGCRVKAIAIVGTADVIKHDEGVHNITVIMAAILADGEVPKNAEPHKAEKIITLPFAEFANMPRPIFVDYAACVSMPELEKFLDENLG
ncbi:MAG: NUDIX domain-containing protein [Alphaproteobacteria bacterium]|nr:NUDIX domain-containing protein [Alphaproteobacteria bacterium]